MDHADLFRRLAADVPAPAGGAIDVGTLIHGWLVAGPTMFSGDERRALAALCRQVDVRRRVSRAYGEGWSRLDPEEPAAPATVAGLLAVLLANAGPLGAGVGDTDGGWGLKCANSALKALDLVESLPHAPELAAWALSVLDDRTRRPA